MSFGQIRGAESPVRTDLVLGKKMLHWAQTHVAGNLHLVLPLGCFALVAVWFATYGDFRLLRNDHPVLLESLYDSIGDSLVHGRFDISIEAVQGEGFQRNGRVYAYNPPIPALPRILLNLLFPQHHGAWAKLFCVSIAFASIVGAIAIYRALAHDVPLSRRRSAEACLATAAGVGSTLTFLTARCYFYHEAIIWSSFFGLLTALFLVRFWSVGRPFYVGVAGLCAICAFFSRYSGGGVGSLAAVLMTALLTVVVANAKFQIPPAVAPGGLARVSTTWHFSTLTMLGALVVALSSYTTYNYIRFGEAWNGQPLQIQKQYTRDRLARVGGSLINPAAIPGSFAQYWFLANLSVVDKFPWVHFGHARPPEHRGVTYDLLEPHASIAVTMPALFILAMIGVAWAATTRNVAALALLCGFASGGFVLLSYVAISERYVHDFFPFLVLAACYGLTAISRIKSRRMFNIVMTAIFIAAVYGALVVPALAFVFQRDLVWGVPQERRDQLTNISEHATGLFAAVAPRDTPKPQNMLTAECGLTISDSRVLVRGCGQPGIRSVPKPIHASFAVKLSSLEPGVTEPLLVVGHSGAADILFIHYESEERIRLGIDHWGMPALFSSPVNVRPGTLLHITSVFDSINNNAVVRVNGSQVLDRKLTFHDWGSNERQFGINRIGANMRYEFRGVVTNLE